MHNIAKKIDVIANEFYPHVGGVETNVSEVYSFLVKRGWDITIHTSKSVFVNGENISDKEIYRGLLIKRYKSNMLGFRPQINYNDTTILAVHGWGPCNIRHFIYSFFLKIFKKKKYIFVLTTHGGFNLPTTNPSRTLRFFKYLFHIVVGVPLVNNTVDAIRAVSQFEANGLIDCGIKSNLITVIKNGIEDIAFEDVAPLTDIDVKRKISNLDKYIIQIGRIEEIKNQATAIKTLPLINKDVKLIILGPVTSIAYKKELDNLVSNLNLMDRVIFWGTEHGYNKFYLIKNASVVVHMAYSEGYCNAIHEAMSQGCVCIVSRNTALEELIKDGENGFCADTEDYKTVATYTRLILDKNNEKHINEMKNNNIGCTYGHTWEAVSNQVESFYGALILNKISQSKD